VFNINYRTLMSPLRTIPEERNVAQIFLAAKVAQWRTMLDAAKKPIVRLRQATPPKITQSRATPFFLLLFFLLPSDLNDS
jgi:hypothetical protein